MSMATRMETSASKEALVRLDREMAARGGSDPVRNAIVAFLRMWPQYITYAVAQRRDPTNPRILYAFLVEKGMTLTSLFNNDALNCAFAIIDFVRHGLKGAALGVTPFGLLYMSYALANLIDIGRICRPMHEARRFLQNGGYLEHSSSVTLRRLHRAESRLPRHGGLTRGVHIHIVPPGVDPATKR